jgi:hypothetical protein
MKPKRYPKRTWKRAEPYHPDVAFFVLVWLALILAVIDMLC